MHDPGSSGIVGSNDPREPGKSGLRGRYSSLRPPNLTRIMPAQEGKIRWRLEPIR